MGIHYSSLILRLWTGLLILQESKAFLIDVQTCPANCICYPDYLSNLVSWGWIETETFSTIKDPQDPLRFSPYLLHNEVYSITNPNDTIYNTVTCVIRNDQIRSINELFQDIPKSTQILSLIQGAGSGNVTIGKHHFEKLIHLVGLDIQGYKENDESKLGFANSLRLEADALLPLKKLLYLNLDFILLQQRLIQHESTQKRQFTTHFVRTVKKIVIAQPNDIEFQDSTSNSEEIGILESQLMFLTPKVSNSHTNENDSIIPYKIYKKLKDESKTIKNDKHENTLTRNGHLEPKIAVAFTGVSSLIHLRLSQCNLQEVSWDMFNQLNSLQFLHLERNDLLFLPDFVFYSTPTLKTLSLSSNRILNLQTVGLAGLLALQKLDVSSNNITHLSELSLPPFPHLQVADFRNNPIETIFPNTFEVMNSTEILFLGNPRIPLQILQNSFFGLTSLKILDITNVKIEILEPQMLKGLQNLQTLQLNGYIYKISFDAFNEVLKLEKLNLSNCQIVKVSMDAFLGLSLLTELDLSNNKLEFLPAGIFDEQTSLKEIYLQNNQLKALPKKLFTKLTNIQLIQLNGNNWHCSCEFNDLDPFKVNVKRTYQINLNTTFCNTKGMDKGIYCQQQYNTNILPSKFVVKYTYEREYGPVCKTPIKFQKREIFDVLRKELKYCNIFKNNASAIIKTSSKHHNTNKKRVYEKPSKSNLYKINSVKRTVNIQHAGKQIKESTINNENASINEIFRSENTTKSEPPNSIPTLIMGASNFISAIDNTIQKMPTSSKNLPSSVAQSSIVQTIPITRKYKDKPMITPKPLKPSKIEIFREKKYQMLKKVPKAKFLQKFGAN